MVQLGAISLFDADPDLLLCVPEDERPAALQVMVRTVRHPVGSASLSSLTVGWGVLVVEGVLAREVTVARAGAAELVGPGDVVLPDELRPEALLSSHVRWTVLEPALVAVLDDHVLAIMQRWPRVAVGLLGRMERRTARLAVAQAINGITRVDARVQGLLWALAGRWGRVTGSGVVVPLRLTHRTMARLVGARRPSVTTAITELAAAGRIHRRSDGSWLLLGDPPPEVGEIAIDRILPGRASDRTGAAH